VPDLESRLARSRSALLDEIEQPPLAAVRRRATRIRRRRAAAAGATALAVLGIIGLAARPWQQDTTPSVTATSQPTNAPVYRGAGIEIIGLAPNPVFDLDGEIADVEFTDATHGVVSAGCDQRCPPLASTSDGGLSWQAVPGSPTNDGLPDLVTFPDGRLLLVGNGAYWSADVGAGLRKITPPEPTTRARIGPGELPRLEDLSEGVVVWSPVQGPLGPLAMQPALTVRWVAPAPAGDGAWWVGGVAGDRPAVAVSHDAGATWKRTVLAEPSGAVSTVAIGTLGTEVYAVARGEVGELRGIYRSTDSGATFTPTYLGDRAAADRTVPGTVSGDPVPLLDGRLLLVEPSGIRGSWWVSDDGGSTFAPVEGLPAVGEIRRTLAGYVAYGLFDSAWTAFSPDGTNWQKLQIY
jgi:hypothetical protein